MSGHIQQRKPPAKRAFHGLAGSPLAVVGRPPEFGVAMTAAERQRRRTQRKQEPEKRKIVAEILKNQRRTMVRARLNDEYSIEQRVVFLRQLEQNLMQMSLRQLQTYQRNRTSDTRGRMDGESSGGSGSNDVALRLVLAGVKNPYEWIAEELGIDWGKSQDIHHPDKGHGPDVDQSEDEQVEVTVHSAAKPSSVASEKRLQNAIDEIVKSLEDDTCVFCHVEVSGRHGYERHLFEIYRDYKRRSDRVKEMTQALKGVHLSSTDRERYKQDIQRAKEQIKAEVHFTGIENVIREQRQR